MLLSDPIPLRTSEVLNAYRQASALPWGFGDMSQSPQAVVQLSDTEFLFLDHAAQVTGVQIDGQNVQGFNAGTVTDSTDHTYTQITLAAPLPAGAQITATGFGMLNPRTGALIDNPGDVLEQILIRSGYAISPAIQEGIYQLRAQSAAEGLTVANRIAFAVTLREVINGLMRSIGGLWCSTNFTLYPTLDALTPITEGTPLRMPGAVISACIATVDSSFDTLALKFDDQSYAAEFRQALTLRVKPSLGEARSKVTLLAPWLRTAQSATRVAERVLTRASGQSYLVTLDCSRVSPPVRIGEVIAVDATPRGIAGIWPVTIIAAHRTGAPNQFVGELIIPQTGLVFDVRSRTIAGGITQLAAVEVAFSNGTATFTITDSTGKLIIGAKVSLDGATPKLTDAQGKVSFQAASGLHTLYVEAAGYQPFSLTITL